jgi:molybdenum cofactor cytidylyltransferase
VAAPDARDGRRVAAIVLAAGRSTRFGSPKLVAPLDGRPLVRYVLDAAVEAGLDPIVLVTGPDDTFAGVDLAPARLVVNAHPEEGLSSSVRLGLAAVDADAEVGTAVILLGDQPRISPGTIHTLLEQADATDAPLVAPAYAGDDAPNPVIARRAAWRLADELAGDRGFGPILGRHPELVLRVPIEGANPDVDTQADLVSLEWDERVRVDREQVDRVREVPDGADFYGPVTSLFVVDPRRTDDPVLDALLGLARPDDTWLDVGSGAGRFALPLALAVREVVALDPSPGMLSALREAMTDHGIDNIRVVEARWPPADARLADLSADVVLIAHVGYDIERIGPFVDALEAAAGRLVVAVLMDHQPASLADPFWPVVHGEARVGLPALPEFLRLLEARGARPEVRRIARPGRVFASRDALLSFLRRQTWVVPDGERDRRLQAELDRRLIRHPDGSVELPDERGDLGVVTWAPPS